MNHQLQGNQRVSVTLTVAPSVEPPQTLQFPATRKNFYYIFPTGEVCPPPPPPPDPFFLACHL